MAYVLASAGLKVVVLEKGPWYRRQDFSHDEIGICADEELCRVDADGDQFPHPTNTVVPPNERCDVFGRVELNTPNPDDCDDTRSSVYPTATELPGDGIDANCDESEDCYVDFGQDSGGTSSLIDVAIGDLTGDCDVPLLGISSRSGDCNDNSNTVYPNATEIPNDGIDQDCSGDDLGTSCFVDADNDGWRTTATVLSVDDDCTDPGEAAAGEPSGDCLDTDAAVYPTASEVPNDGIDQDCSGADAGGGGGGDLASLVAGDLVITEVMQDPSVPADSSGECFEVLNTTGADLDLDGLEVSDLGVDDFVVTGSLVVPAGGRVVFGVSTDPVINGGVPVDYACANAYFLSNGDDEIVLGFGGVTFDEIAWTGTAPWPDPTGASMQLDPALEDAVDNDDGASWCESTSVGPTGEPSTPGASNDPC